MSRRSPETSLYAAVKAHLERLGYEAKGEVCGCDIVAVRPGEPPFLVITELKMGFTLDLLLQGVDRLAAADEVWLAARSSRRGRDRDRRAHKLCRLLGFGLLGVDPARQAVEVLAESAPYRPRPNLKRRALLLREHSRRQGDPNQGGASRTPIMTAYRQQALICAAALGEGPRRPRDLRAIAPDAGRIMLCVRRTSFQPRLSPHRLQPGVSVSADGTMSPTPGLLMMSALIGPVNDGSTRCRHVRNSGRNRPDALLCPCAVQRLG